MCEVKKCIRGAEFRPLWRKKKGGAVCISVFDPFKSLHGVFMGAAFTERVTDGISNRHLDKYYFPLLKVAALLFSTFIQEPVL